MCSGHHRTQQCLGKIQNSESVDLKCANCGEKHSANSNHCSVLREKMQRKMNNAMSRILATKQSPPPPVTSTAFPATHTGDIDTRKRVMSGTSVRGANNYAAAAAKHHVPRSVVLAARGTSKFAASSIKSTVSLMHGSKDNSTGGSNYDSLFVRTVAFPVQVAYWIKEVIAPCGTSVPCQL